VDTLREIVIPDIGDFANVPVTEILVAIGDSVAVEAPLVAIESDKATMEIPAPCAGIVREILIAIGDNVSAGTPIVKLQVSETAESAEPESLERRAAEEMAVEEPAPDSSMADGLAATASTSAAVSTTGAGSRGPVRDWDAVYAGPAVRRRARERGMDLRMITGSGRRGRITLEDLDRPAAIASSGAARGLDSLGLAPWPTLDFADFGEVERVPLTRIQKLAGANLARNWVGIPHVTHNEHADITELEAFRKQLNAEQSEVKVTMVALLLKAAATALKTHPRFNASLDGDELVVKHYYHLGFAADTPRGLVVPVIRDVERKGLYEVAGELSELSSKARAGRLSPAEMSGSTFTVSSLGGIGGTSFTPIVNAPEVAILGVVRSAMRPVWDGQQFQPRLMLPLSLSYDHRVIDGAAAARFCAHLAELLSDMRRLLL
jgi:pyruvate dehydrogenase E2 component (dihydrolipoamide acetyltransferase)